MTDLNVANQGGVDTVEKRGRGRPLGSKNKPKSSLAMVASSPTLAKCRPGRPLGSKNKKHTTATTDPTDRLDVCFAHPSALSSSSGDQFSFFSFAGAQCREQHCLPMKFTEFMEDRELCEAIIRE
jgi:hypothetical protein